MPILFNLNILLALYNYHHAKYLFQSFRERRLKEEWHLLQTKKGYWFEVTKPWLLPSNNNHYQILFLYICGHAA